MKHGWIILAVVGIAAGMCRPAFSEDTPKDYFNRGSAQFIKGHRDEALAEVNSGLQLYPDDYYLQALKKAIEENKQQQQNQDQQKKDQQKKDQDQKDQDKKDQDQKKQDQANQDKQEEDQKKDQEKQDQKDEQKQDKDQEQQAEPVKAEDMTKEEAMQLLDALKQQEQADREKIRVSVGAPVPVEKDW